MERMFLTSFLNGIHKPALTALARFLPSRCCHKIRQLDVCSSRIVGPVTGFQSYADMRRAIQQRQVHAVSGAAHLLLVGMVNLSGAVRDCMMDAKWVYVSLYHISIHDITECSII